MNCSLNLNVVESCAGWGPLVVAQALIQAVPKHLEIYQDLSYYIGIVSKVYISELLRLHK